MIDGAADELFEVAVRASQSVGTNLVSVVLTELPPGLRESYHTPGQYLVVQLNEQKLYLALASAPGDEDFELLVRTGGGSAADQLAQLTVGARLKVRPVAGKGFPRTSPGSAATCMVVAGSGIAPMRAIILHAIAAGQTLDGWSLYWGAKNNTSRPYLEEVPAWQKLGLQVVMADSEPLNGASGQYVQDALRNLSLEPSRQQVFLCGMKPMIEAVKEQLTARGLPQAAIHLNF
jgi:sulfhydrogenase subunit gamma (sulfur reductase)